MCTDVHDLNSERDIKGVAAVRQAMEERPGFAGEVAELHVMTKT